MAVGARLADIPYFPGERCQEDPCREIVYDAVHTISYVLHKGASRRSRLVYFPFFFFFRLRFPCPLSALIVNAG